jgi:hypothetical protein
MTTMKVIPRGLLVLVLAATLGGCMGTIAHYNPIAYQNATSLKVECLAVIAKASEPYDGHKAEAEQVQANLDKAYEFAKGLPKNQVVTKQWEIIRDPKQQSAGGVLAMWKETGKVSPDFAKEAGAKVAQQFDQLIVLEGAKIQD